MAKEAATVFTAYLDSQEVNWSWQNEEDKLIRVGWKLENTKIAMFFFFDEDNTNLHIVGRDFLNMPSDKFEKMCIISNEVNTKFRWAKFTVDKDDEEVLCEMDAVIQLDSCAEEAYELMVRMTQIVDEAYAIYMKGLWA